MGTLTIRSS